MRPNDSAGWMSMSRAESTWASVPSMCAPRSAAMCPSPRCSRSMVAECHSRATGSPGTSRVRMPAYITRPSVGALVAALVVRSAARTRPGSRPVPRRGCAAGAALPRSRAATEAAGGIVSQALWGCAVRLPRRRSCRKPRARREPEPGPVAGAAGEVAVPVGAVAECGQFLVALVGGEGDQADRLQELEHAACDVGRRLLACRTHRGCPFVRCTDVFGVSTWTVRRAETHR